jgi:signal peptidase
MTAFRTTGRVVRYVTQIALASVAVAAALLLVGPRLLDWQGVIVLTGSMEPALDTGGVAFVDRVPPEKIGVGDIMTFTRPDSRQQVTHRVTEVTATSDGPQFRTKGDANDTPDGWTVTSRQVVGKVRFALPRLGGAVRLLVSNRQMLALFMAVPALFLLGDDLRRWRRERRAVRHWLAEDAARVPVADAPLPAGVITGLEAPAPKPRRTRPRPALPAL